MNIIIVQDVYLCIMLCLMNSRYELQFRVFVLCNRNVSYFNLLRKVVVHFRVRS